MTSSAPATAQLVRYTVEDVERRDVGAGDVRELHRPNTHDLNRGEVLWLDVPGIGDDELLGAIAERFGLHPLAMEDVVHEGQRPKVDVFDDHLFIVATLPGTADEDPLQVSLFLAPGLVVTMHSRPAQVVSGIVRRIERQGSRMRRSTADYLAYALLDAVVDEYAPCVEAVQRRVEDLGEDVLASHDDAPIKPLFAERREFVALRREIVWMREMFMSLKRADANLIADSTLPFLDDCIDHVAVNLEAVESGRDLVDTLIEVHTALVGQRMNEIMKVLTAIATIFIPLSFVTGVFGMNFERMTALAHPYGFRITVALMALVAIGMLVYFRRLGWIGGEGKDER